MPPAAELPSLPPEAVLAFLKQASVEPAFDAAYVARSLKISIAEARQLVAMLLAAGYMEDHGKGRYRTTESGDTAAGAKPPRQRRGTVDKALGALVDRIRESDGVQRAIVFGQYLTDHDLIQAADVGIALATSDERQRRAQLKTLRARSPALNLHEFAPWMEHIRHVVLWPK